MASFNTLPRPAWAIISHNSHAHVHICALRLRTPWNKSFPDALGPIICCGTCLRGCLCSLLASWNTKESQVIRSLRCCALNRNAVPLCCVAKHCFVTRWRWLLATRVWSQLSGFWRCPNWDVPTQRVPTQRFTTQRVGTSQPQKSEFRSVFFLNSEKQKNPLVTYVTNFECSPTIYFWGFKGFADSGTVAFKRTLHSFLNYHSRSMFCAHVFGRCAWAHVPGRFVSFYVCGCADTQHVCIHIHA